MDGNGRREAVLEVASCINDRGKTGKGPRTLPKPGNNIHLTKYGYSAFSSRERRRSALKKASAVHGILPVLRRINLLRNYQSDTNIKNIFTEDVEFMKKLYYPYKKTNKKKIRQRGGDIGTVSFATNNESKHNKNEEYCASGCHVAFVNLPLNGAFTLFLLRNQFSLSFCLNFG